MTGEGSSQRAPPEAAADSSQGVRADSSRALKIKPVITSRNQRVGGAYVKARGSEASRDDQLQEVTGSRTDEKAER